MKAKVSEASPRTVDECAVACDSLVVVGRMSPTWLIDHNREKSSFPITQFRRKKKFKDNEDNNCKKKNET